LKERNSLAGERHEVGAFITSGSPPFSTMRLLACA